MHCLVIIKEHWVQWELCSNLAPALQFALGILPELKASWTTIVMSAIHGVPEAPHLQDGDLEAFRTQWLIVEGVAVAGPPMVQVCIEVKSLAITASWEEKTPS